MKRLLFVVLLLGGALVLPASSAQAVVCSGTSGVTVIVQFPDGHIETGCATGDPGSGIAALQGAGFSWDPVPGQMGATVCRINGQPAAGQTCWQPPDYWAYFYAQRGGSWTYSTMGAGNRDPKPGTVEGWKFGGSSHDYPDMDPPGAPAKPAPTTKPTGTTHATGGASNPVVGPDETPTSVGAPTDRPTSRASATSTPTAQGTATSTPTSTPGDTATSDPTATGVGSAVEAPTQQASTKRTSSNHSWIWGVVLVGVLGAAAGITAVRRRKA